MRYLTFLLCIPGLEIYYVQLLHRWWAEHSVKWNISVAFSLLIKKSLLIVQTSRKLHHAMVTLSHGGYSTINDWVPFPE